MVIVSLVFPVLVVWLERVFFPVSIPEPHFVYSVHHKVERKAENPIRYVHLYTFTLQNTGSLLDSSHGAEFMVAFRSNILRVMAKDKFTRGSFVEKCGRVDDNLFHYFFLIKHMSGNGSGKLILESDSEISNMPMFHYGGRQFSLKDCDSNTDEGMLLCEGKLPPWVSYRNLIEEECS